MTDGNLNLETIDLITAGGSVGGYVVLNVVVGGKTLHYRISRRAAASAAGRIAEALAAKQPYGSQTDGY